MHTTDTLAAAATTLMLVASSSALAQTRDDRPIRGAYLRPPTSLTAFESTVQTIAEAGIQDLYLETFYHGLASNDSDVFNDRFSFDYLAEAIRISAKYSVRVHAWTEGAYWSFGGSGDYILNQHPEWKVTSVTGSTDHGDITGQVFVNLAHPGVQAMLREYFAELAAYPGLEGIQTDYHRYPLDFNTGDQYEAPYSYDAYMVGAFTDAFGYPPPDDDGPGQTGQRWDEWTEFRRAGIAEAANQMHMGINGVNPSICFSAAIFPTAITSSAQLVKMQDWPSMAANNYIEAVYPMAYGSSTNSIRNDLQTALNQAGDTPVVATLAILTGSPRPSVGAQLATAQQIGIEDFALFEASVLVNNTPIRTELDTWLDANATPQTGDFNEDGYIDANDRALLASALGGADATFDLNSDGTVDSDDQSDFEDRFMKFRFGADGIFDARDLQALLNTFGDTGPSPTILHLYDLDGDGAVDLDDSAMLEAVLLDSVQLRLVASDNEGLDANDTGPLTLADGAASVDLYVQARLDGNDPDAAGLVTFDGRLTDDDGGVFTPVLLTNTEALGFPLAGDDFQGRTGMFPQYRATIGPNNTDPGNGVLEAGVWEFLPLNLSPGSAPGGAALWTNVYKVRWSSPDDSPRSINVTVDGSFGGYLTDASLLRAPVPVDSATITLTIPGACPCDFDGSEPVDVLDLLTFLGLWFPQQDTAVPPGTGADFDGGGTVTVLDLLEFLACWFPATGGNCP